MILDWLRKRFGHHVCEEFTRWETKQANFTRLPVTSQEMMALIGADTDVIKYTRRWQERSCTICGKIQQRNLRQ